MKNLNDEILWIRQLMLGKYPWMKSFDGKLLNESFPACNLSSPSVNASSINLTSLYLSIVELYENNEIFSFNVFAFTLTSSIDDFWSAGAYELAFIIAAFSGAWPYIKLLLLLLIWLYPIKAIQRKKALFVLDQLGKYSFIDLYVCIFMVVSFYLTITETVCIIIMCTYIYVHIYVFYVNKLFQTKTASIRIRNKSCCRC